jgi:Protein of unknown function (DUF3306)
VSVHRDTESEPSAEGFAERWSRRKQEAGRDEAEAEAQPVQTPLAATEPARELTDDDMPPVDSLDEHSDFGAFLSPGVSEQLRTLALRKLFRLPGMHLRDGLDDYDDDFTQFRELGNTITHEMRRMLERELQRSGDAADSPEIETETVSAEASEQPPDNLPVEDEQATTLAGQEDDENTSDRQS